MEPANTNRIDIQESEEGLRLDKVLVQRFPEQSRSYFQSLIERELVLLNDKAVKKRAQVKPGHEVTITFALTPEISLEPEAIPLDIVYEDEHILAINKPVGLVVHPGPGNWSGTFVNGLLHHCKSIENVGEELRPGIVHRLDKNTSGLLLAAKTSKAHKKLVELFAERRIQKTYWAICVGQPGGGSIDAPIARHPVHRKRMAVREGGKAAITHYETLSFDGALSLVEAKPKTGRTHQIRVHLKHLGAPILGDETYGSKQANSKYKVEHHLLHAHKLEFLHPITGNPLVLEAPLPEGMARWVKKIEQ